MRKREPDLPLKLDFKYGTDHIYSDLEETIRIKYRLYFHRFVRDHATMFGKARRADRRIAEGRPLSSCRRTFSLSFQLISKAFRRQCMSDRASKAPAETSLPGEPRIYDA